jgi:hypothetical protein
MKHILSVLIGCVLPLLCVAQDTVSLQFRKSDVRIILDLHEQLTGKPVFVSLDLQALVTLETEKPIPRPDAIESIRTTLLERYGIELRTTSGGETLAGWSNDSKYPRRSESPMTQAEREARPRGRVRIIEP